MKPLSQNDNRWKNQLLGYNTSAQYTLGNYGCFLTVIAMIAGTTPDVVNNRMKAVGGFINGGEMIWGQLEKALPGVKYAQHLQDYNNEVVKNNLPCFVMVDGAPIGGDIHAVLYIGNGKLIDPWDGKTKPTSTYKALKFAVIKGQYKDPNVQVIITPEQTQTGYQEVRQVWRDLYGGEELTVANIKKQKLERDGLYVNLTANKKLAEGRIGSLENDLLKARQDYGACKTALDKQPVIDIEEEVAPLRTRIVDLERELSEAELTARDWERMYNEKPVQTIPVLPEPRNAVASAVLAIFDFINQFEKK